MGLFDSIVGVGAGIAGALAGGAGSSSSVTTSKNLAPASELEKKAEGLSLDQLNQLQALIGAGPGMGEVRGANSANSQLLQLLQSFSQGGFLPNQQDFMQARQYTNDIFAGQQEDLNQMFEQNRVMADRRAASMGRSKIDPVLQNMLFQQNNQAQRSLDSQKQSAFAQYASQLPMQRLQFTQAFQGLSQGLASQALQNRQALLNLGQNIQTGQQNFRANSAEQVQTSSTPGSFSNALLGGLAGLGSGMEAAPKLSAAFSGIGSGISSMFASKPSYTFSSANNYRGPENGNIA